MWRVLRPVLKLMDSVCRLYAPRIPVALFAAFFRHFEERVADDCSGDLLLDIEGSLCDILRGG